MSRVSTAMSQQSEESKFAALAEARNVHMNKSVVSFESSGTVSKVDSTANAYEGLDKNCEYLDLSCRNLGTQGLFRIFSDMETDRVIKQLNLSYNISVDEVINPAVCEKFFKTMERYMRENRTLTCLDFAGNHTFDNFPHPDNEHTVNYVMALTKVLKKTKITHLDISDNWVTGRASRELKGLTYMMQNYMVKGKAFKCRLNYLNSQGWRAVTSCLGITSSLTYLDISDNFGGLDPFGNPTMDGADALAQTIPQTVGLRVLKVARNFLSDHNIVRIAESIAGLPEFMDLDIGGNYCRIFGGRELKKTIMGFACMDRDLHYGFRELVLSGNMLTETVMLEIAHAIKATDTLKTLCVAFCSLYDDSMSILQDALAENYSVLEFDVRGNPASDFWTEKTEAEVEASNIVHNLEKETDLDASTLNEAVYYAVARKLKYLDKEQLKKLHHNPSFNVPRSQMRYSLHLLQPPSRQSLLKDVKTQDARLQARLEASKKAERRIEASLTIARYMDNWFRKTRERNAILKSLEEVQRREDAANAHNVEDDEYGDKYARF